MFPGGTGSAYGFQAVILCGPGDSLSAFTSNPADFPKALVPIANRPMVWYPIDWCKYMGITEFILVTPPESAPALETALTKNHYLRTLGLEKRPLVIAPKGLTHTSGTGEIFRAPEVIKAITSDFVVLPCDLVCEVDPTLLANEWCTLQSGLGDSFVPSRDALSVASLASGEKSGRRGGLAVYYPAKDIENVSFKQEERDFLATAPLPRPVVPPRQGSLRSNIDQVVMSMPLADMDDVLDADGDLPIRNSLLQKHGRIKVKTSHKDAHIYFFAHWVLDMMQNEAFDTISEDVVGWWAKAQWQPALAEKLGLRRVLLGEGRDPNMLDGDDNRLDHDIDLVGMSSTSFATGVKPPQTSSTSRPASRVSSSARDALTPLQPLTVPKLLAYIQPTPNPTSSHTLIHRADTYQILLNINLYLAKQLSTSDPTAQSAQQTPSPYAHSIKNASVRTTTAAQPQSRISDQDSLVSENVTIDSRVNIRESVIGSHVKIGAGSRLTRCVLMEGVTVGENVTLSGCLLGKGCVVQGGEVKDKDKTRLTDCQVQNGFIIPWGTESKEREFMHFEALEEDEDGPDDQGRDEYDYDDDQDENDDDDDSENDA